MRAPSNNFFLKAASLLAINALVASSAQDAGACGGFFCSRSPVDQTAEHILFTVNADESVTAIVQISYSGDKDNFAWIVPVPGVPQNLDATFPELAFQALDNATEPQYTKNTCFRGGPTFGAGGAATAGAQAPTTDNGVTVISRQVVGPYETTTLEGTSADAIVQWLQKNDYRITDKMIPVISPYVADGMKFIALRLTPQAGVSDISPLSMTYPGDQPMIPIKLTAIAAQPEMGLVVWVFANQRFGPDNYVDLKVPDKLIEFNEYGYPNYLSLVSKLADQVGGEAFVTEYAKPTSAIIQQINQQPTPGTPEGVAARDKLLAVLQGSPFLTRLYARMSAEEMLDDPSFRIATDQNEVSNIHDLTDPNFDPNTCSTQLPPDPCEFNYCGRRGVCAPTAESAVAMIMGTAQTTTPTCVCAPDATARPTSTANGQLAIYCEPLAMNFDAPAAGGDTMSPLFAPACEGFDCGPHGKCMPMNGNPTCQCDAGFGATVQSTYDTTTNSSKTVVSCVAATSIPALPRLPPPGQQTLAPSSSDHSDAGFCSVRREGRSAGWALVWIAAVIGASALRRRAVRAHQRR